MLWLFFLFLGFAFADPNANTSCQPNNILFALLPESASKNAAAALANTWLRDVEPSQILRLADIKFRLNLFQALRVVDEMFTDRPELSWVLLCESLTYVNISNLHQELLQLPSSSSAAEDDEDDSSGPRLFAHGVYDSDVKPTHHYWGKKEWLRGFLYPVPRAGLLMNRAFLQKVVRGIPQQQQQQQQTSCSTNFQIDPAFELMKCISDAFPEYIGVRIEIVDRAIHTHIRPSTLPIMRHNDKFCVFANTDDDISPPTTTTSSSSSSSSSSSGSGSSSTSHCITIATTRSEQMYQLYGSTPPPSSPKLLEEENNLSLDEIAFGVSTHPHSQYNDFVVKTWGKSRKNGVVTNQAGNAIDIIFFSHTVNPSLPSVDVGIPNVDRGFCGKSERIFAFWAHHYLGMDYPKHFTAADRQALDQAAKDLAPVNDLANQSPKKWFFRADDDTSVNLSRLRDLLARYDPDQALFIGQVYGYQERPYLTGGAGVVLSRGALRKWAACGENCRCPSLDYFDDMFIGSSFEKLGVEFVNEPGFHQEVPEVYPSKLLALDQPISFHRIPKHPKPLETFQRHLGS